MQQQTMREAAANFSREMKKLQTVMGEVLQPQVEEAVRKLNEALAPYVAARKRQILKRWVYASVTAAIVCALIVWVLT